METNLTQPNSQEKNIIFYSKRYLMYAAGVFGIVNLMDIFSSNATPLVKSYVIEEFFLSRGIPENIAYAQFGLLGTLGLPLMILAFSLRFIADKYGRKPALIINIIGMTIGALLIIISSTFVVFMIGNLFSTLFLAADIQLLMITEESPKDQRSQYLEFARIIGLVGAMGVPLMKGFFLTGGNPNWRGVFYLPCILGIFVSIVVIFTLKESSIYQTMKLQRQIEQQKEHTKSLVKQTIRMKGIKILIIITIIGSLGTLAGLAEREYMEPFLISNFTLEQVNTIYYLRFGISMVFGWAIGYLRDRMGRKAGFIVTLVTQCIFLILFLVFVNLGFVFLTGLSYGLFIYAVWMNSVTAGLIVNELTPTQTRGTMTIVTGLVGFGFMFIWTIIQAILVIFFDFAWLLVIATIPFSLVGIFLTIKYVPETRGTNLITVGKTENK